MKRWIGWALAIMTLVSPLAAQDGTDTGWVISRFESAYRINADRTIDVTESIDVDFGSLQRHGIYREIPIAYRKTVDVGMQVSAGRVKVGIDQITVTDSAGTPLHITVTRGDRLRIRIGDANRTVTGRQRYLIHYRLERGLGFFEDHDELYWQVTGTEWPVPILAAHATVTLAVPGSASALPWEAWCYAGWSESNDHSRCTATAQAGGGWDFGVGRLDPGEGLTLVASFPTGIIEPPTEWERILETLAGVWPLGIPLAVLGVMTWLWRVRGREPERESVVPSWKVPTDLRPGPAGVLWDQTSNMNDIVATLIDLAVRGYLRITEVAPTTKDGEPGFTDRLLKTLGLSKMDWELERLTPEGGGTLARYESLLLDGIFTTGTTCTLSDLTNEFYTNLSGIHSALYDTVVAEGLFNGNPRKTRIAFGCLGVIFIPLGILMGAALANGVLVASGIVAGLIILAFARAMPARTVRGAKAWEQLRGLEEYIRRAEKLELELRQGPERTTRLFEELLPYAIALGVSDIWVKQFGPVLAAEPPRWYGGGSTGHFVFQNFSSGLHGFQTAATRTLGSSPGSSSGSGGGGGGGSVGGGGGGGGGGSW